MANIKTLDFLPSIFRTDTNRKFLNATLDQLVSQPDLRRVNGYVGRKFSPTFKNSDNYQPEPNTRRQNYQLEPTVIVKNSSDEQVEFYSSYIDLLEQIEYYGGDTTNQSRLFAGESYSFNGLFDFDKFINFNQYYWLENGPDAIDVFGSDIDLTRKFVVTRDPSSGSYYFSGFGGSFNPTLKLAFGGTYEFQVNQPGHPFWIQSAPGISGTKLNQPNVTSRNVLGVENNGIDVGTIKFTVPQSAAQDYFLRIPLVSSVDLSTEFSYKDLQNRPLSEIISKFRGIDGITSVLENKTLIFINEDLDDSLWSANSLQELYSVTDPMLNNFSGIVPVEQRRWTWRIRFVDVGTNDPIVNLNLETPVTKNQKVFVKSGATRAQFSYYVDPDLFVYYEIPDLTAGQTQLYYQDGTSSVINGVMDILQLNNNKINVDAEIIGKLNYVSPNGVTFTNGLKISFDSSVVPDSYSNREFYIEGVGKSIRLLPIENFVNYENYTLGGEPDYITINRGSRDLNPWSRSNRWFHADIVRITAEYRGETIRIDQTTRANRPIIEFEADIQLYNFGRQAKRPVDILDFSITDAFEQIELENTFTIGGVELDDGMRVVFANDLDPTIRNNIYVTSKELIDGEYKIHLTPADDFETLPFQNLVPLKGTNQGQEFYYNGETWILAQQKTLTNQKPLFDVFDQNGISFSDTNVYPNSSFIGTEIFSYKTGTGNPDSVLGFPLSYRNFNQIGDIQFVNNFDTQTFMFGDVTVPVNSGVMHQNLSLTDFAIRNVWTKNSENSKQYQILGGIYNGVDNLFPIDILPNDSILTPYIRVYINGKLTPASSYSIVTSGVLNFIEIDQSRLEVNDTVDIVIYSDEISQLGYYSIPSNLEYNTENKNFETLTLGQLRNHLVTMAQNFTRVSGDVPGFSNIRDLDVKPQGGNIVQHASPVLYSQLFLVDSEANFIKSIDLARYEYAKVKNKLLELSTQAGYEETQDIPALLDTILKKINIVKTKNFPWYYSDMVPYGDIVNTVNYTVIDAQIRGYEISEIFNDVALSNRAVLVYLNNRQLIKGRDYTFDQFRSGITINNTVVLESGDKIRIMEYSNTDGNYIPETPTKLGLYPKFTPAIILDDTYRTPITVIQGHDGSITPAFNDFRDQLLLEFELRIYNNIKSDYTKNIFDLYDYAPGKFRDTGTSIDEFNRLLTAPFLRWAGSNQVEFTNNSYFQASNPWTWNYRKFNDSIDGERLQGTWRGIYSYFYDTDRPHTHPWEMLGFSEQPDWWEDRYGPAPYTGGNLVLWGDLSRGYIHAGPRAGYDAKFVRPELLTIIPVDDRGQLRSPETFALFSYNSLDGNASYAVGDQGPVETAWRRSSDYPYAVQRAIAISNPAFYFGSLMNQGRYYKNTGLDQYVFEDTLQRVTTKTMKINGRSRASGIERTSGYINWIADYLRNLGISPDVKLTNYLENVSVQLSYKMAGFSDKSLLQIFAEQSSPSSTNLGVVVPSENYLLHLNKSTPVSTIVYSAVIVERSENGYTVSGFNADDPFFTIIPSLANNNAYAIAVNNDNAVIYQDFQKTKIAVPYGFEFNTKQQVVDFLISYERFLKASGFRFDYFDTNLELQRDFKLSVREFLSWSQQGWQAGNVLVMSPIMNRIEISLQSGVVDEITNTTGASRILDTSFNFIKNNQFSVIRQENEFVLNANYGQTIALAILNVVEYEHALIFDNETVFSDIIYKPELGDRQFRVKLVGSKTGSWTGELSPPGFIYNSPQVPEWQSGVDYKKGSLVSYKSLYYAALNNLEATTEFIIGQWEPISKNQIKSGLLPNFSYNAQKFNNFFDLDNPEATTNFDDFSSSMIGFRPRQYMSDFGIDTVTQAKFYQGYVKEKGTINAINAFTAAGFNGVTSDINLYEEWAMRVGEYGAIENNKYVEVQLNEGVFTGDPLTFTLLSNGQVASDRIVGVLPQDLYRKSTGYQPEIYKNRDRSSFYHNDIGTAGYPMMSEVDATIFDLTNYQDLNNDLESVGVGYKIWAAKNFEGDWDVLRVTETNISITQLDYAIDNLATFTTSKPHNLVFGDLILVKGFNDLYDGFYQVYNVESLTTFTVPMYQNIDALQSEQTVTNLGFLLKTQSARLKQPTNINNIQPIKTWINGDKLWVDDIGNGNWAVYDKSSPWSADTDSTSMRMDANAYVTNSGFGTSLTVSYDGKFAAAGMPNVMNGNVAVFVANVINGNVLTQVANIGTTDAVTKFGYSLDSTNTQMYVGAPGNGTTNRGRVYVYNYNGNISFNRIQTLTNPYPVNGDGYGHSISSSADGHWLFVSAPKTGNVYVYNSNTNGYFGLTNTLSANAVMSSWAANVQFGATVKATTDASQIIVTAPYEATNGVRAAGAVYVYDRSIESFIARGQTAFITQNPVNTNTLRVYVNGQELTSGFTSNSSAVIFNNAPVIGYKVDLETSAIRFMERLISGNIKSGSTFGTGAYISGNDTDIYVGSPGYSEPGYLGGVVHRYVNQGRRYGEIESAKFAPTVTNSDNIRINGHLVKFTGGNTASVVNDINNARIPGVTAVETDYTTFRITSNVVTQDNKLSITLGNNTSTLGNLGLTVYSNQQVIKHVTTENVEQFGSQIVSSSDGNVLVISATHGTTYNPVNIDRGITVFDDNSTTLMDLIKSSGSVYVYGRVDSALSGATEDQYALVQRLENTRITTGDQFGSAMDLNNDTLLVGAPGDDTATSLDPTSEQLISLPNSGAIYTYKNPTGLIGWDPIRVLEPTVDIDTISRLFIFNNVENSIISNLDYIDPAKGKILGAAEQDIDYKTSYDPAVYNASGSTDSVSLDVTINADAPWGKRQVGKTWWNLDALKFVNYEQGSLISRANNWGRLFPGSDVQVCEWVESAVTPDRYTGDGTPLYPDAGAYVVETYVDPGTKITRTRFFFWVRGKTSVNTNDTTRRTSVANLEQMIVNPQAQGIPYAAVIRNDSISLYNVGPYISGNATVIHMDYDTVKNTNIIHSEYQLVEEGNSNKPVPERIINKLVDSLSETDIAGTPVPNPALNVQDQLGLDHGQSLFINPALALKNWLSYVNRVLLITPVVQDFVIDNLYAAEPVPGAENYDLTVESYVELGYIRTRDDNGNTVLPENYSVLVNSDETQRGLWSIYDYTDNGFVLATRNGQPFVQSYYTPFYWDKTDWYDISYDATLKPTYLVETIADIQSLNGDKKSGETVRVNNNGRGQFVIYRYNSDLELELVGLQDGTIQLNNRLLDHNDGSRQAVRLIFDTLRTSIFTEILEDRFSEMLFFLINYILSEQKHVDWVFKTSFVSVIHKLRKLEQFPNYIRDDQTYYENYIDEVKPYRSSLREYLLDYEGLDAYEHDVTDFDLTPTFNENTNSFRSPDGTQFTDTTELVTNELYKNWYNHHTYSIQSVDVAHAGSGERISLTTLNLYDNANVIVYAGNIVTQTVSVALRVTSNTNVYAGNVITQPFTGASGTVFRETTGNVINLYNVTGTFGNTGNTWIYRNGANANVTVSSVATLSSGANATVFSDSTDSIIELVNVSGTFTNSNVGYLYLRNSSGAITANLEANVALVSSYVQSTGYYFDPEVTVVGGGGSGAIITAQHDPLTNTIKSFRVVNPGSGYTSTPTLIISGPGVGAVGYPRLVGQTQIDSIPTVELQLSGNATIYQETLILQPNSASQGTVFTDSISRANITLVDTYGSFRTGDYLFTSNGNLGVLVTGVSNSLRFVDNSYNKVRTIDTSIRFDRIGSDSYNKSVLTLTAPLTIETGDTISQNQVFEYQNNQVGVAETASALNTTTLSNVSVITLSNVSGRFTTSYGNLLINGVDSNVSISSITTSGSQQSSYYSDVVDWHPGQTIQSGQIVSYRGSAYRALEDVYSTTVLKLCGNITANAGDYLYQYGTGANATVVFSVVNGDFITVANVGNVHYTNRRGNLALNGANLLCNSNGTISSAFPITVSEIFDFSKYQLVGAEEFNNANDRILAYYNPRTGMPNKDLNRLLMGTAYPGVQVQGVKFDSAMQITSSADVLSYDKNNSTIRSANVRIIDFTTLGYVSGEPLRIKNYNYQIINLTGNITVGINDYITQTGSSANVQPISEASNWWRIAVPLDAGFNRTGNILINNVDTGYTIQFFNTPVLNTAILDIKADTITVLPDSTACLNLVECPFGSNISLEYYDYNDPIRLDSVIQSNYKDTALGSRPEDILIDGGSYYDTFNSHAPQELVPGIIFDNLHIKVLTRLQNNTDVAGYRIIHNMQANAAAKDRSFWPEYYKIDSDQITVLTTDLHLTDANIFVANAQVLNEPAPNRASPGVVYINGERIVYYERDVVNNRLSQLRRAVDGTGAAKVHATGSSVEEVSISQYIPFQNQDATYTEAEHTHTTSWLAFSANAADTVVTNLNLTLVDNEGNEFVTSVLSNTAIFDGTGIEGSKSPQSLYIRKLAGI
jgi:hypothetical protein